MIPIRTAVIGAGHWGCNLVRNVRASDELALAAIADNDPERLREHSGVQTFDESQSVLNCAEIDAVLIATPPESHVALVRAALESGKHVLCEKPLAFSAEECQDLGRLADSLGLRLMVDCTPVFLQEIQAAKAEIAWQTVREIRCLRTSRSRSVHRADPLWDLAPHDLAVLRFWLGRLPRDWICTTQHGRLQLLAAKCGSALLEVSVGHADQLRREITVRTADGSSCFRQQQTEPEPLGAALSHFAGCIRTGRQPLTNAAAAAEAAEILNGAAPIRPSPSERPH